MDLETLSNEIEGLPFNLNRLEILEHVHLSLITGTISLTSVPEVVLSLLIKDLIAISHTANVKEALVVKNIFSAFLNSDLTHLLTTHLSLPVIEESLASEKPLFILIGVQFLDYLHTNSPQVLATNYLISDNLISLMPNIFTSENIELSEYFITLLIKLCKNTDCLDRIFLANHNGFQSQLKLIVNTKNNDVIAIRVLTTIAEISSISDNAFEYCREAGFFDLLIAKISPDDPLSFVSYLDVASLICRSPKGFDTLQNANLMDNLAKFVTCPTDDSMINFIKSDIVIFFANLLKYTHFIEGNIAKYEPMLATLFDLENSDERNFKIFLETIIEISSYPKGREILKIFAKFENNLKLCGSFLSRGMTEQKIEIMRFFSILLEHYEWMIDEDFYSSQTLKWYKCIDINPMGRIFAFAKQPFEDVRCAGMKIIRSVSKWRWGQEEMLKCPGLIEYLLDSSQISEKTALFARYDVIECLANSVHTREVLGAVLYVKIKKQLELGPYNIKPEYVVAIGTD